MRAVPPFVAHPGRPPRQQTGHATFDHRAAVASGAGQLHLAWGTVASHPRGGEQLVDCRGRWRRGERFHRVRAPHREDPAGVEGRAQLCVGEGESAGPRVDGGGGPRGDVGESRLHFVDQGQPVAGSPRVAHGQVPGKNKAGGGLGDEARLTAKLRGTVALAFADGGKGRSVGMDNVTAGQGLAGGEAAGLGDDLLRGGHGEGQRGGPGGTLLLGQLRRTREVGRRGLRQLGHGLARGQPERCRLPPQAHNHLPLPPALPPKATPNLGELRGELWSLALPLPPVSGPCALRAVSTRRTFCSPWPRAPHQGPVGCPARGER